MSQALCPSCGAAVNLTAGQGETKFTQGNTLVKHRPLYSPSCYDRLALLVLTFVVTLFSTGCNPSKDRPEAVPVSTNAVEAASKSPGSLQSSTETNVVAEAAPKPALPKWSGVSRESFEARFGKALCSEDEFSRKFAAIYGVEFTNFVQRPVDVAKQIAELYGMKAADGLSEGSYYILVPQIFVDTVPSNTLASIAGLQPGDEILACYKEDWNRVGSDPEGNWERPPGGGPQRLSLPLADLSLWNMDLIHNGDSSGHRFVIKTARGELRLPEADVYRYVDAIMSLWGFADADPDRTSGKYLNRQYQSFEGSCAWLLPECRNLGAKFHTEYHRKTGLTKDQQTQILETLIGQKGYNDEDRRRRLLRAVGATELFDGYHLVGLHQAIQRLATEGTSALRGGLLSQVVLVKGLRPNATFCVYRSEGIDALAFFENGSLLFSMEYPLGPGKSSPLTFRLPSSFSSEDLRTCLEALRKLDDSGFNCEVVNPSAAGALTFQPRELNFCPLFRGKFLFYRGSAAEGDQGWKTVNLGNFEDCGASKLALEYRRLLTNELALLNHEAPLFVQNNRLMEQDVFDKLDGGAAAKWRGKTNAPDVVLSWPAPGVPGDLAHDRNMLCIGNNYSGQLVLSDRAGYVVAFGRSDFFLAELLDMTAKTMKAAASERAFWDRYRQMMGGPETSAGRLGPEQRLENARKWLEYLNKGQ